MNFANKLDYTFEVADRTFIMCHDERGGHVFVMNECGDALVNVFNYSELWTEGEAFPLPMAKMLMVGFEAGFNDGVSSGVFRAQYEMRQAMGL